LGPVVNLHDATLVSVSVDWALGSASIHMRPGRREGAPSAATIEASGIRNVEIPRRSPWGPSVSVNHVACENGRLVIEVQSGDWIVVEADEIVIPS
jgi:hypothetical protein